MKWREGANVAEGGKQKKEWKSEGKERTIEKMREGRKKRNKERKRGEKEEEKEVNKGSKVGVELGWEKGWPLVKTEACRPGQRKMAGFSQLCQQQAAGLRTRCLASVDCKGRHYL